MRMKHFLTAAFFFLMAGGLCSAQSDSQSLADVAKNNRKNKAVLVVNEDTISSIAGTVSVVGADQGKTGSSSSVASDSAKAPAQKSSTAAAHDSPQVVELKKQLNQERRELEGWQDSAKQYEKLLEKETSEFRRDTYRQAMENDKTNVSLTRQKIDEVQAQLAKAQQSGATGQSTAGQSTAGQVPANTQPPAPNQ
jgi:hypothetical protein